MANKRRAEIDIDIGGKRRKGRVTFDVMAEIEAETGLALPKLVKGMLVEKPDQRTGKVDIDVDTAELPGAGLTRFIVHQALAAVDPDITLEQVGDWMAGRALTEWSMTAFNILLLGFAGDAEGNAEAPPENA